MAAQTTTGTPAPPTFHDVLQARRKIAPVSEPSGYSGDPVPGSGPSDHGRHVNSDPGNASYRRWTFVKAYAATWPHAYAVRTPENAAMVLALAQHIFVHGTDGRFYAQARKYPHEGGKVYWTMDSTP